MDSQTLSALAGVILSLAFSYLPGVTPWYEALGKTYKKLVMGVMILAVAGAAFALSCGDIVAYTTCDKQGVVALVESVLAALVANQAAYKLSKPD